LRFAIDQHHAGTAFTLSAAKLRATQAKLVAQYRQQQALRV
jgi:hypothetical protein